MSGRKSGRENAVRSAPIEHFIMWKVCGVIDVTLSDLLALFQVSMSVSSTVMSPHLFISLASANPQDFKGWR